MVQKLKRDFLCFGTLKLKMVQNLSCFQLKKELPLSKKTCPRMTQAVFSGPRWGETPLVKSLNGGDLSQLHILAAISFGCTAFATLHEERAITHQSLLSSTY